MKPQNIIKINKFLLNLYSFSYFFWLICFQTFYVKIITLEHFMAIKRRKCKHDLTVWLFKATVCVLQFESHWHVFVCESSYKQLEQMHVVGNTWWSTHMKAFVCTVVCIIIKLKIKLWINLFFVKNINYYVSSWLWSRLITVLV